MDYSLLLYNTKRELFLYAFLALNESFNAILIDNFDSNDNEFEVVLSKEPKGKWEAVDETIVVPYDGITIELIEESLSWSYYFKDSEFIQYHFD